MDPKTARFQQHRPRLFGLAYRMLGIPTDAEDVVHEAWLRWQAQDMQELDDTEAWLVTVTTRLALDRLRRARNERRHYVGPWLPEPVSAEAEMPDRMLERDETLTLSFLLLLERLGVEERAAFLLREVFDYSHAETAAMLDISEAACRQRIHRARLRLREGRPRFQVDTHTQRRLLERFIDAMEHPDLETLRALFAEDAVHIADSGGEALATLHPLEGADRLARLYMQIARNSLPYHPRYELTTLNGCPALLTWSGEHLFAATWIDCQDERITGIRVLRHPQKLARLIEVTKRRPSTSLH